MNRLGRLTFILLTWVSSAVSAADTETLRPLGVGVEVHAGLLGLGAGVAKQINPYISGRVGFNAFSYSYSGQLDSVFLASSSNVGNVNYDVDLKLQTLEALIEVRPFKGVFHLTGGLLLNSNELTLQASPAANSTFDIGGQTYSAANVGTLNGVIGFDSVAPYLGLGWGSRAAGRHRLSLFFDVGVMFQGVPESSLSITGPIASNVGFQADLAREAQSIDKALDAFQYYPVVTLGVAFRL